MSETINSVPERADVNPDDTWDISALFADDKAWEEGLALLEAGISKIADFRGRLGESAEVLAEALDLIVGDLGLLDERLGYYIMLRQSENLADGGVQGLYGRYISVATRFGAAASWVDPEIQAVPDDVMQGFLTVSKNGGGAATDTPAITAGGKNTSSDTTVSGTTNSETPQAVGHPLAQYRIYLQKLLRFKSHILSGKEEALLARQMESTQTPSRAFGSLTNVDMEFGTVKVGGRDMVLTQSTYASLLLNKDRSVREEAYRKFYGEFDSHKNTLAQLYSGSVLRDKYLAEVRGYESARAKALFPDNVPENVYDNLVDTVRANLPALHSYYQLRAERLGVSGDLRPWDVHASLVDVADVRHTWDQAVDVVCEALAPLGSEYVSTLRDGLTNRWADRYENQNKRSGAFSAGSYTGSPCILMNFKEDVLRDVFTLAHEGGHSMHSWYSVRSNPFAHYNYTIFEAEVSSTFNEQLLARHFMDRLGGPGNPEGLSADQKALKAYLVGKQIDDVITTIYRQTMFAEFERDTHATAESGQALTVDSLRGTYRKLLEDYFGPAMNFEELSDLGGLRIPHFYRAFYVYKYATGLSAAMALSKRVLGGSGSERDDYLNFLRSGGSRYPLESLKLAGVDMDSPAPVQAALDKFASLVEEFKTLTR